MSLLTNPYLLAFDILNLLIPISFAFFLLPLSPLAPPVPFHSDPHECAFSPTHSPTSSSSGSSQVIMIIVFIMLAVLVAIALADVLAGKRPGCPCSSHECNGELWWKLSLCPCDCAIIFKLKPICLRMSLPTSVRYARRDSLQRFNLKAMV